MASFRLVFVRAKIGPHVLAIAFDSLKRLHFGSRKLGAAGFMKYLVLKIAAGVFLGILAALDLDKAIDIWELHEREKAYAEQQRLEAEALSARMKRAAEIMNQLTPDKMVTLCGSPLRENYAKGIDTLSMWYTGTDGHK